MQQATIILADLDYQFSLIREPPILRRQPNIEHIHNGVLELEGKPTGAFYIISVRTKVRSSTKDITLLRKYGQFTRVEYKEVN